MKEMITVKMTKKGNYMNAYSVHTYLQYSIGGLAITDSVDTIPTNNYAITHIASGRYLAMIDTIERGVELINLLTRNLDWTIDEDIIFHCDEYGERYYEVMRGIQEEK